MPVPALPEPTVVDDADFYREEEGNQFEVLCTLTMSGDTLNRRGGGARGAICPPESGFAPLRWAMINSAQDSLDTRLAPSILIFPLEIVF